MGEEERAAIARIFHMQAQSVQQAATAAGVEPTISFFEPGDPRRRPAQPQSFAPGMAGQAALRDQAEFGAGAVPMGGVTTGPRFDPSGHITVCQPGPSLPAARPRGAGGARGL